MEARRGRDRPDLPRRVRPICCCPHRGLRRHRRRRGCGAGGVRRRPAQVAARRAASQPGRLDHHDGPQPCHRSPAPRVAQTGAARRGGGALADNDDYDTPEEGGPMQDDRLRLIFTCCHPALSQEAQVALTLRLLGGLSTKEVARSFLVAEPAMAQRLARAKRKIKAARIRYRVPEAHELPERLRPVLAVVYLIYNAGLTSPAEPGLCAEAIRLARILATLMPD